MTTVSFVFLHGGGQGGWVWDETIAAMKRQSGGAVMPGARRAGLRREARARNLGHGQRRTSPANSSTTSKPQG